MGKAQSKRSVDITTETKKGPDGEEVTGKLEKIEDIDQKQVNGDATPQEKNDAAGGGEKKDAPDETENDKDLTTEKIAAEAAAATPSPTADGSGDQTANETSPKEDDKSGDAAAADTPSKEGEEISPLADEGSNKKSKKEKLKKKWSFRSLSFGKKDKSKPKTESTENAPAAANAENATAATNGEAAETNKPAEGAVADATKSEEAATAEAKPTAEAEKIENGVATEAEQKQMNGQETLTTIDETEQKKQALDTNETATTTTVTSTPPASNDAVNENQIANEKIVSNGTTDVEKNGVAHDEHDVNVTITAPIPEESIKSIPAVIANDEKPHQNGTNGEEAVEELTAATKTLQIEVKTEHQNDINNSTSTTTTINTKPTTTANTNISNSTTIPADIINTEQKTINNNDDENNVLISTIHTDTLNTNTNNTSDKSFSSKKSIENIDEQNQPCKVIVSNAESPNVVGDDVEVEEEEEENTNLNEPITENAEIDTAMQQQQQLQEPPPLPVTAPPSQVVIFALKDNENQSDQEVVASSDLPITEINKEVDVVEVLEDLEAKQLTPIVEIVETANGEEGGNNISITESIDVKLNSANDESSAEIIEVVEIESLPLPADVQFSNVDDFEAQALNIVDQIEKELEQEESADYDEIEQQINIEIQQQITESFKVEEQAPVSMDLCSSTSSDEMEILPPPPPSPPPQLNEIEVLAISQTFKESITEISNGCHNILNVETDLEIENENENERRHHNNEHITSQVDKQLTTENIINNGDEDCDLIEKINKLNFNLEEEINMNDDDMQNNVVAIKDVEHIEANVVQDVDDIEEKFVISTDKEMPTAKELKENAAAAEIKTQDLPVTCE